MIQRILFVFLLAFSGLTWSEEDAEPNVDPWEGFNRAIFDFNEVMDKYVARPVAVGYQYITPKPVDDGISNFFSNLDDVLVVVNDLLQLKFLQALSDTSRFLINSTVGLFGFIDVASHIGLEKHNEDFGQTLGYWGVGTGPYIVLPFLGPSNLRDATGRTVDTFSGLSYTSLGATAEEQWGLFFLKNIDLRADIMQSEELITGEKYTFIRSFYLQRRDYLVKDGVVEDEFDDDFEDEEFFDDEDEDFESLEDEEAI